MIGCVPNIFNNAISWRSSIQLSLSPSSKPKKKQKQKYLHDKSISWDNYTSLMERLAPFWSFAKHRLFIFALPHIGHNGLELKTVWILHCSRWLSWLAFRPTWSTWRWITVSIPRGRTYYHWNGENGRDYACVYLGQHRPARCHIYVTPIDDRNHYIIVTIS